MRSGANWRPSNDRRGRPNSSKRSGRKSGVSRSPSSSMITGRCSTSARKPTGSWASSPCVKAPRPLRPRALRARGRPTNSAWRGGRRQRDNQAALDAARKAVMDQAIAAADTNNRLAGDRARAAELRRRIERVEQERFQAVSKLELASTVLAACIERRRKLELQLAKARSTRGGFAEEVVRVRNQHDEAEERLARLQEEKAVAVSRQKVLQAVGYDVVGGDPGAAANLKGTVAQVPLVPQGD